MLRIFVFLIFIVFGCKTSNTVNIGTPIELKSQGSSILYLEKIEIHPSYTKLDFVFLNNSTFKPTQNGIYYSTSINIGVNQNIRLYDNENFKSYQFIKAKRITIQPKQIVIRQFDKYNFSLIFQKIEKFTEKIDIIECENNGQTNCWNFYNIDLENEIVEYFEN